MNPNWRDNPATEEQKEKLRYFGCTWDEGIKAEQASDALEECARQFPDAELTYQKNLPATKEQIEKLRFFGCTWNGEITVGKASDALAECAKEFPDKESAWQLQKKNWSKMPGTLLEKAFEKLNEAVSEKPHIQKVFPKKELTVNPQSESQRVNSESPFQEVTIQKAEKSATPPAEKLSKANNDNLTPPIVNRNNFWHPPDGNLTPSIYLQYPPEPQITDAKYRAWDDIKGREYALAKDRMRWAETVRQIETENQRRYNVSFEEGVEKARQFLNQFRPTIQPVPVASAPVIEHQKNLRQAESQAAEEKQKAEAPGESEAGLYQSKKELDEWIALHERLRERRIKSGIPLSEESALPKAGKIPTVPSPPVFVPPTPEQIAVIHSFGQKPPPGLTYQEAKIWVEQLNEIRAYGTIP
ncbi:MAG: hypothetical protein ACREFE_07160, partial [Limisphaerales bacterium]